MAIDVTVYRHYDGHLVRSQPLWSAGQQFHYVQLKNTAGQTLPDSDFFIATGS